MPDVASARTNPKTTALMEQRAKKESKLQPLTLGSYKKISIHLRNAVLVSEDSASRTPTGPDQGIAKKDWDEKRMARGASTITQQLARTVSRRPAILSENCRKFSYPVNWSSTFPKIESLKSI
jgi:membrane peptidoglycan carboxypeptidase